MNIRDLRLWTLGDGAASGLANNIYIFFLLDFFCYVEQLAPCGAERRANPKRFTDFWVYSRSENIRLIIFVSRMHGQR